MTESRKRPQRAADWTIIFEDASSLRNVVDAVSAVMHRVVFKVACVDGHHFLMVDGADAGFTCCVSARLQLDKVTFASDDPPDEFTFCVDCKHVIAAIDNPSCAHGTLTIEGINEDALVRLRMRDPDQASHEDCCELSTFVDAEPAQGLLDMTFPYIIEIDLTKLRDMIKKARKARAERIRVQVHLNSSGGRERSLVIFSASHDFYYAQKYCHETHRNEDGSLVVRAATDGTDDLFDTSEPAAVDQIYPLDKIDAFAKNMPTKMLVARVKQGLPIMFTHELGGVSDGRSFIRFLVAPVTDE